MINKIIQMLCNYFYTSKVVCRALLIPFIHQLDYKIQSSSTIYNAYELAPAAGPVLIGIGHQLVNIDDDKLEEIKSHVSRVLPGVDSRIVMEYSVLIASALLVNFFFDYCRVSFTPSSLAKLYKLIFYTNLDIGFIK